MEQYYNNEKVDQRSLKEVVSFYIEEAHDACDRWCINAQNWYRKVYKKCKVKISMIHGWLTRYLHH